MNTFVGYFMRQTSGGWDHEVWVTLSLINESRVVLSWKVGNQTENGTRSIDLTKATYITMRRINGKFMFYHITTLVSCII